MRSIQILTSNQVNVHIVMTIFFSNKYLTYDHAHLLNRAHIHRITEYSEKIEPNIRKCKTRGLDSPNWKQYRRKSQFLGKTNSLSEANIGECCIYIEITGNISINNELFTIYTLFCTMYW